MRYSAIASLVFTLVAVSSDKAFGQCTVSFNRCPSDTIIVDCDNSGKEGLYFQPVLANPSAFCSGFQLVQTLGPVAGSIQPLGTYFIEFEASGLDANQQIVATAVCAFTVQIVPDLQPPQFSYCPPNMTITGIDDGTGHCSTTAFWSVPTSTDPCGVATLTNTAGGPCGSTFPDGTHTVTYTSVDASGNPSTCSFTITVLCVTGSEEPENSLQPIHIYPNPNTGFFTVELPKEAPPGMRLRLTDLTGRLVQENDVDLGITRQQVDARILPEGLYFLQVISENRIIGVGRLVKQ